MDAKLSHKIGQVSQLTFLEKRSTKKGRRGQVTIFIILGILIVFVIIIGFFLFKNKIEPTTEIRIDPVPMVEECVQDSLTESVGRILSSGGLLNFENFAKYNNESYNYLCYQDEYYLSCYNRYPLLKFLIESNIRRDTLSSVQNCFDSMRADFEDRGFSVSGGSTTYSVLVQPGEVLAKLEKDITVSKGNSSIKVSDFDAGIPSSLYDLIEITRKIINDESQYCAFDHVGYTFLYPKYDIKKMALVSGRAYSISDRNTLEEFKFAVRSCPAPSGL